MLYISLCENLSSCSPCILSTYIICVELWFRNLQIRSVWSDVPKLPTLIRIICCLSIWSALDTGVPNESRILTESSVWNNLQSIAQENRCQLLDPPVTDPVQYISNHPWIERLSKRYRVDVLYRETWLAYFRLTRSIQSSISLPRNEVQAHLKSTYCWGWRSQIWHC